MSEWIDEAVHLVPPDPLWTLRFTEAVQMVQPLVQPWLTGGLHHVGSTAIPGIMAKPVVDILAGVASLKESIGCIDVHTDAGWWYAAYRTDEMHWFCYPRPDKRQYHLHVAPTDGPWFRNELRFRDRLRAHPATAGAYEALKRDLAARFPTDREAYTEGKTEFIQAVLNQV